MTTHIVCNASNFASRFPRRSSRFSPSHSRPHPLLSNENIATSRNIAIWPARSMRPRLVVGLFIKGGRKPSPRAAGMCDHGKARVKCLNSYFSE